MSDAKSCSFFIKGYFSSFTHCLTDLVICVHKVLYNNLKMVSIL